MGMPHMQSFINGLRVYLSSVEESPQNLQQAEANLKEALGIEDPVEHDEQVHEAEEDTIDEIDVIDRAIRTLLEAYSKSQEELNELHSTEIACRDAIRRLLREHQQGETMEDEQNDNAENNDKEKAEGGDTL